MNKLKSNKLWIIYGIVFAAFVCMGVFAGLHHEPWADEAQSWLIARDLCGFCLHGSFCGAPSRAMGR